MVGLGDLQEGQTVSGRVRRVEAYGIFITLVGSGVTGLCHISEVADEKVTDLPGQFHPGQGGQLKASPIMAHILDGPKCIMLCKHNCKPGGCQLSTACT